jgi:hypothetical protein
VLDFGNMVIGSNEEIPIDLRAWDARLREPGMAQRFGAESLEAIRERLAAVERGVRNPVARVGFNRDLFPRDEFGTPASW